LLLVRGAGVKNTRAGYGAVLVANVDRVAEEVLMADYAGQRFAGAAQSWDTMLEEIGRERRGLKGTPR